MMTYEELKPKFTAYLGQELYDKFRAWEREVVEEVVESYLSGKLTVSGDNFLEGLKGYFVNCRGLYIGLVEAQFVLLPDAEKVTVNYRDTSYPHYRTRWDKEKAARF